MRTFKLGLIVACSCFIAMPALAQNSSSIAPTAAKVDMDTQVVNKRVYMEKTEEAFDAMDTNNDGTLSSREIASSNDDMNEGLSFNKDDFMGGFDESFSKLDTNKDGTIDTEEIMAAQKNQEKIVDDKGVSEYAPTVPVEKVKSDKNPGKALVGIPPINADQIRK